MDAFYVFACSAYTYVPRTTEESSKDTDFSPDVTEEGIKIVEGLLKTWASRTSSSSMDDDEDVIMSDELSPQAQLEELKTCFAEIQPRIDGNPWVQSLLASL